jgi:hypothetical protein
VARPALFGEQRTDQNRSEMGEGEEITIPSLDCQAYDPLQLASRTAPASAGAFFFLSAGAK